MFKNSFFIYLYIHWYLTCISIISRERERKIKFWEDRRNESEVNIFYKISFIIVKREKEKEHIWIEMFSKILEKLFGSSTPFSLSSSPQAPKTFAQKKRSLFFNRYAGVVYFLICWHFFGSVVLSAAKEKAKKDGY